MSPAEFSRQLETLFDEQRCFEPEGAADLMALAMRRGPLQSALHATLHKVLLGRTLRHAVAHSHYYSDRRSHYETSESRSAGATCHEILSSLPVLRREDLQVHNCEMLATDVKLRMVSHTSGSTGQPVLMHRSEEEVMFLQRYYSRLFAPIRRGFSLRPLSLSFPNLYHGTLVPLPSLGFPLSSGVTDDTLIQDAARILTRRYSLPGCAGQISLLSGLAHHIVFFTAYLLETGISPAGLNLETVTITGGYLATHWREWLEVQWNCRVIDRWSMTEASGGANRNGISGLFQFDPHLVAEVIHPTTGRPIEGNGTGELVITNLHPFTQLQPLIRYATGDLVHQTKDEYGLPNFAFLGKLKNCLVDVLAETPNCLVSSAHLCDILGSLPDTDCVDYFPNISVVQDRLVGSTPIFALSSESPSQDIINIRVSVQLRWNPAAFPERAANLCQTIESRLLSAPGSALKRRVEAGTASVTVCLGGPGSIKGPPMIKI
ncbi:CoF synthetase [Roseimicrobium sp. ORNL1]|uniref:CoF synthetase n=1 Tax=Roseimicrobium sp. ORNL1 TaxID=2711231 RepID=UPI0013E13755|nr:CoF synthetase [Roseimicrobium sp. ORNL1]QIF05022.1 CoF synthetase [Roseimicrobium sp. ORNL1]